MNRSCYIFTPMCCTMKVTERTAYILHSPSQHILHTTPHTSACYRGCGYYRGAYFTIQISIRGNEQIFNSPLVEQKNPADSVFTYLQNIKQNMKCTENVLCQFYWLFWRLAPKTFFLGPIHTSNLQYYESASLCIKILPFLFHTFVLISCEHRA